jgi:hypothetical protein
MENNDDINTIEENEKDNIVYIIFKIDFVIML